MTQPPSGSSLITFIILVPGTFSEVSQLPNGVYVLSHQGFLFAEEPVLTTDEFPPDLDTTSVGLMVTQPDDHVFDSVMDEMLQYTSNAGITMVSGGLH